MPIATITPSSSGILGDTFIVNQTEMVYNSGGIKSSEIVTFERLEYLVG